MYKEIEEFRELMDRIKAGDTKAAMELVERYGEDIRRAVRRSLNIKLRPKFDSLDFVQLVWSSFFRISKNTGHFERPEELAAFLVAMARNKVGMETRRRLSTKKYNLNREVSLEEQGTTLDNTIAGQEPTPLEFAIAKERWNRMLLNQSDRYQQIIQLRLQGHTNQDIADKLHIDESTVRRFLKQLLHDTAS